MNLIKGELFVIDKNVENKTDRLRKKLECFKNNIL